MAETPLNQSQETFLEECALEFSNRFTDSDLEYKKIYDSGIPKPPIMCPWYTRSRFNDRGDRGNEGRYGRRGHYDNNRGRYDNNRDNYDNSRSHYDGSRDRHSHSERSYRPY